MTFAATILTLYPEMFPGPLGVSLAGKALERLGARVRIAARPDDALGAEAIVLPGVGRFGAAMERLDEHGFAELLRSAAGDGVPVLGICLGLQLLFTES